MSGVLTVDILQKAQPLLTGVKLRYGDSLSDRVDLVTLVREKLADPRANIQLFTAPEKPLCGEVKWPLLSVQSRNRMSKETLDMLSEQYVLINVVYDYGFSFGK